LTLPLPPLPEQQKIAAILCKWDELIATQTQLIKAKEKQKTSLMQKLLSGEVRFPGFEGEWETVTLGEIAEFSNGKAHENIVDENGLYKLITSKFISTDGKEYRRLKNRLTPLFKNDIVMVMSDIPNGKALGKCYLVEQDDVYSLNQRIGRFVIKKHDSRFMYYLLNRNSHFLAFDSGVGQTNLRKDDILECPLFIPKVKEQEKIATTLCACDEELQLLKDELEAIKLQKKGLMQQLLTGKIRVSV
ncbi:MAG: restriction endonuclease subunit S, partial [Vicingaceae bacterium]|nr:restriction endonuclease subunit S [Vicingaceae bacterium]